MRQLAKFGIHIDSMKNMLKDSKAALRTRSEAMTRQEFSQLFEESQTLRHGREQNLREHAAMRAHHEAEVRQYNHEQGLASVGLILERMGL